MAVTCADGSTERVCGCNDIRFPYPPNTCSTSDVSSHNGVGCPRIRCGASQQLVVTAAADPAKGKCCPTETCVRAEPLVAPSAAACWNGRAGRTSQYGRVQFTCTDGTTTTACGCNSPTFVAPPGVCNGSSIRSFSGVGCPMIRIPCDGRIIVETPARPAAGQCCATFRCAPRQPVQPRRTFEVATNNTACWDTSARGTEFATVVAECADGTFEQFCGCSNSSLVPPGTCKNVAPRNLRMMPCGLVGCNGARTVAQPANPAARVCCPTFGCALARAAADGSSEFSGAASNAPIPGYAIALVIIAVLLLLSLLVVIFALQYRLKN